MEQKDYKLEIMNYLIGNNYHVRILAKKLETNHMQISRKVSELCDLNVLDFKQEGKNKVYFIKDSVEARSYIFMTENYKLVRLLKKYPNLRFVIDEIRKDKKIKLAILFGSYAKGLAKRGSDIDIYIETLDSKIKERLELMNSKLSVKIGKYDGKNLLIKEMEKNHVIINGVEIYYGKF